MSDNRYQQRGVSAGKEDVHNAIKKLDKGLFPQAFCKIVPDYLTGDDEYCIVMHADGAGTKSSLAYMYWKKTGDLSVWKGIAQDALIMNLDDLLCVGATGPIMLSSTIGRNKNLIPGEVISEIINGTEELLTELRSYGLEIHSTGGETADVPPLFAACAEMRLFPITAFKLEMSLSDSLQTDKRPMSLSLMAAWEAMA
jgi:phosphoribosylformylglycinamidine cyclo-ligase